MDWPPDLDDVRDELKRESADVAGDHLLQSALDAALAFVRRPVGRAALFNVSGALTGPASLLPSPDADLAYGTARLAVRLHTRRRSPDGLVDLGELGQVRVPSFDPDIDRMLGIGRWAGPVIA
jgi:hypothetical protein